MAKTIAIANPKGGVGKTTTALNLAASLAVAEKSVLLIGMDPNGSLSMSWGMEPQEIKAGIYEIFTGSYDCFEAIHNTELTNLDLIPCNIFTHEQEIRLDQMAKNRILLRRKLHDLTVKGKADYDFIIIDTPPAVNDLTISALYSSDSVLIPMQSGYYSLKVVEKLLKMIQRIKSGVNPKLKIEGILLNFFEKNTRASIRTEQEANQLFGELLFKTYIPKNTALSYAAFEKKPLVLIDACAPGAIAYMELAKELIVENEPTKWQMQLDADSSSLNVFSHTG